MSRQTKFKKVNILGVEIDCLRPDESVQYLADYLKSKQAGSIYVVKPYVEFMTRAYHDPAIKKILGSAELSLADGVSLQWAASFLYGQPRLKPNLWQLIKSLTVDLQRSDWREQIIKERGAGVDATTKLLQVAEKNKWRVGIITEKSDKTTAIKNNLKKIYPDLNLAQVWPGFFGTKEESRIVQEAQSLNLDLLFVARGFPRQEKFISQYQGSNLARILIGEGGTFDYDTMGGPIKRAPQAMRQVGLEWLWRLFRQPQRIFRMLSIPRFIWLVFLSAKAQK